MSSPHARRAPRIVHRRRAGPGAAGGRVLRDAEGRLDGGEDRSEGPSGTQRIAGATLCAPSEGNLQCSWLVGTKENGRSTYERFKSEATACLAPLGLTPNVLNIAGADTTSLESPGNDPDVAVIYPGNATVSVSVLLSQ